MSAWANSSQDPILILHKKRHGEVVQGEGPEVKPQHHTQTHSLSLSLSLSHTHTHTHTHTYHITSQEY
jgi:hypothetical protein